MRQATTIVVLLLTLAVANVEARRSHVNAQDAVAHVHARTHVRAKAAAAAAIQPKLVGVAEDDGLQLALRLEQEGEETAAAADGPAEEEPTAAAADGPAEEEPTAAAADGPAESVEEAAEEAGDEEDATPSSVESNMEELPDGEEGNVKVHTVGAYKETNDKELPGAEVAPSYSQDVNANTVTCLEKGFCKVSREVRCDVDKVEGLCPKTNHVFDKSKCDCVCDDEVRQKCEALEGPQKPEFVVGDYVFNEPDCSCKCADADCGDKKVRTKYHPDGLGCACVCEPVGEYQGIQYSIAEKECKNLEIPAKDRATKPFWEWDDAACECTCKNQKCQGSQTFREDTCTCTCGDNEDELALTCLDQNPEEGDPVVKWDPIKCSCVCVDSKAEDECISKKRPAANMVAGDIDWKWTGLEGEPKCTCECQRGDRACQNAKYPNWVVKVEPECGCQCDPADFDACSKKIAAGAGKHTSLWSWNPFPICSCDCGTSTGKCDEDHKNEKEAWMKAHPAQAKNANQWAAQYKYNAETCACECKLEKAGDCNKDPDNVWDEKTCTCTCPLADPGKCAAVNAKYVFDVAGLARAENSCDCVCDKKYETACEKMKQEQTAGKAAKPHLKYLGSVTYDDVTCDCDCPVSPSTCDRRLAKLDPKRCLCECDVDEKKTCEKKKFHTWSEDPKCSCDCDLDKLGAHCKTTKKTAVDAPVCDCKCDPDLVTECQQKGVAFSLNEDCECVCTDEAGTAVTLEELEQQCSAKLDGSSEMVADKDNCECVCDSGPGSAQYMCSHRTGKERFKFKKETCSCECKQDPSSCKKDGCDKITQEGQLSTCEVWSPEECKCKPIKEAICPTNVHTGCNWLFNTLKNDLVDNKLMEGAWDTKRAKHAAQSPSLAVCNTAIASDITKFGTRFNKPEQEHYKTVWGHMSDSIKRNLGTNCRAACEQRFKLAALFKSEMCNKNDGWDESHVTFTERSCHVFSRKDASTTGGDYLTRCKSLRQDHFIGQLTTRAGTYKRYGAYTCGLKSRDATNECRGSSTCEVEQDDRGIQLQFNRLHSVAMTCGWED